ncbi:hypothetical protein AAMO2058_000449200 [Amorphochlora amoebiformis]
MSIPLAICLENLVPLQSSAKGKTSIKILKRILSNTVSNPGEAKFRKLNAAKLMPKLAAENLAPIYIIEHAGFVKEGTKYILPGDASVEKIANIIRAIEKVVTRSSETPGSSIGDGLTQKERDALEWEREQKRLEEVADKKKKERDARRAAEAAEAAKRKEEEDRKRAEEEDRNQAEQEAVKQEVDPAPMESQASASKPEASEETKTGLEIGATPKAEEAKNDMDVEENESAPPKKSAAEMNDILSKLISGKSHVDKKNNPAGEGPAVEVDEGMKDIISRLKAGKSYAGEAPKKKKSKKPSNFAQMTLEEKHAYAVKEREKKARELAKQRERNRKEIGKAQLHLSEQNEWQKLKNAAALKKKQEKEAKRAKKRLLAKMKRERAQKNKEIEEENRRLRAMQAERLRQQGMK